MVVMQQPSGMPGLPGMFGAPPMFMNKSGQQKSGGDGSASGAGPNPVISQQPPQIVYPK